MRIPRGIDELSAFCREQIDKCLTSQRRRINQYRQLRNYYLYGNPEMEWDAFGSETYYNLIRRGIDKKVSLLFGAETTNFMIDVDEADEAEEIRQQLMGVEVARQMRSYWRRFNVDTAMSNAITWALVYNTAFLKFVPHVGKDNKFMFRCYMVEPACVGVPDETAQSLADQEVVVHQYSESVDRLKRKLYMRKDYNSRILPYLRAAGAPREPTPSSMPAPVQRLIDLSRESAEQAFPSGRFRRLRDMDLYIPPEVTEDQVQMFELWVFDDDKEDYTKITVLDPDMVLSASTRNPFVDKSLPLVKITPNPDPQNFWGESEIHYLLNDQDWVNEALRGVKRKFNKICDPSYSASDMEGAGEANLEALRNPGGTAWFSAPGGRVDEFSGEISEQLLAVIKLVVALADDQQGVQDILEGKGTAGVRSQGQVEKLAQLGGSRIAKRALMIEDSVDEVGNTILRMMKRYDPHHYGLYDETLLLDQRFVAHHLSENAHVRVDSHTSSPLYQSDLRNLALLLMKAGTLQGTDVLDLVSIPLSDAIRRKAAMSQKRIEELKAKFLAEQEMKERQKQLKQTG